MTGRYPWGGGFYDMSNDQHHCVDPSFVMLPALLQNPQMRQQRMQSPEIQQLMQSPEAQEALGSRWIEANPQVEDRRTDEVEGKQVGLHIPNSGQKIW